MKGLDPIAGTDNILPFELCKDVMVIDGWGNSNQVVTTACTPILIGTSPNASPDITAAIAGASREELLPKEGAFAKLLGGMQRAGKAGLEAAVDLAESAAETVADQL